MGVFLKICDTYCVGGRVDKGVKTKNAWKECEECVFFWCDSSAVPHVLRKLSVLFGNSKSPLSVWYDHIKMFDYMISSCPLWRHTASSPITQSSKPAVAGWSIRRPRGAKIIEISKLPPEVLKEKARDNLCRLITPILKLLKTFRRHASTLETAGWACRKPT